MHIVYCSSVEILLNNVFLCVVFSGLYPLVRSTASSLAGACMRCHVSLTHATGEAMVSSCGDSWLGTYCNRDASDTGMYIS